jgi:ATP-dependent RNA helicase DeaD
MSDFPSPHSPPASSDPAATPPPPPEAPPPEPKGPSFAELGLRPEVLRAIEEMGFSEPMKVQAATFPPIREGRDLMVQSRTGSGKTAAFGIPFANSIVNADDKFVQALVLLPTRELALQVAAELSKIAAHSGIVVVPVYGGAPMGRQVELLRAGGQIVCGTPGRVLDHLRRGTLNLDRVKCAVLDECDEMLSMGFQEDIEAILERTPETRQTLLFSATVPEGIQRLSRRFLRNPEFLKLSADFVGVHEIKHLYYSIPGINRENELLRILAFEEPKTAIIFCNTREETGRVAEFLRQNGHEAEAISSDLAQSDREKVMARMRAGGIRFLVATDVAARGIDIENLSYVFNYTFPEAPEVYIHRTGRTGRAGRQGTAVSLIGPTEVGSFYYLKLLYKIRPDERALPSEIEIRSHREGERVQALRAALTGDPGGEWKALARRLMASVDGERLLATLLAKTFERVTAGAAAAGGDAAAASAAPAPSPAPRPQSIVRDSGRERAAFGGSSSRAGGGGGRGRGGFDRGPRPDRGDRPERPQRSERGERGERGERPGRPEPRRADRGPRGDAARTEGPAGAPEREFWEVWSDERTRAAAAAEATPPAVASDESSAPPLRPRLINDTTPVPSDAGDASVARLYLNLGRKDGAGEREIQELLASHAGPTTIQGMDIMNTHTYLNVAPADADRLCAALTGKELAGREVICERAKPRRR